MSATIFWRPVKIGRHQVGSMAPSWLLDSLEKAFGARCPLLGLNELLKLRAMAATISEGRDNPFAELADAVEAHEAIQVEAEY